MNNTLKNLKEALFAMILVVMCSIPMTMLKADKTVPAENIEQFVDVFKRIKEQYVDKIDDEELFKAAIKGMVSGLDPHSAFLSNDDFNELKIGTTGKFGGLGIEITTEDGYVKVITPIDDTPAQRAGILAGDLIVKVGETSVKDMEIGDAVKLMRGEPGTKIQITVLRKKLDEPLVIDITRQIIYLKELNIKFLIILVMSGFQVFNQIQQMT